MNFGPAYGHWTLVIVNTIIVLVFAYEKLAKREEREAERLLGEAYRRYASRVPRFFPHLRKPAAVCPPVGPPIGPFTDPSTDPPANPERSSS